MAESRTKRKLDALEDDAKSERPNKQSRIEQTPAITPAYLLTQLAQPALPLTEAETKTSDQVKLAMQQITKLVDQDRFSQIENYIKEYFGSNIPDHIDITLNKMDSTPLKEYYGKYAAAQFILVLSKNLELDSKLRDVIKNLEERLNRGKRNRPEDLPENILKSYLDKHSPLDKDSLNVLNELFKKMTQDYRAGIINHSGLRNERCKLICKFIDLHCSSPSPAPHSQDKPVEEKKTSEISDSSPNPTLFPSGSPQRVERSHEEKKDSPLSMEIEEEQQNLLAERLRDPVFVLQIQLIQNLLLTISYKDALISTINKLNEVEEAKKQSEEKASSALKELATKEIMMNGLLERITKQETAARLDQQKIQQFGDLAQQLKIKEEETAEKDEKILNLTRRLGTKINDADTMEKEKDKQIDALLQKIQTVSADKDKDIALLRSILQNQNLDPFEQTPETPSGQYANSIFGLFSQKQNSTPEDHFSTLTYR